jgi:dTDP-4-dehydrorhamnose 3,5-epimerase
MAVKLFTPRRFGDDRGWFMETFSARRYAERGLTDAFVQDNHSYSAPAGTIRGLHFQTPPRGQGKLVRCVRGAIWDVAVDVRKGSPTYGRHVAAELTADNAAQLWIPVGFAHGFVTMTPDTEVEYKCTDYYAPECDGGVAWNDPDLALPWPLDGREPTLSIKDQTLPRLAEFDSPFAYDGRPLEPLNA